MNNLYDDKNPTDAEKINNTAFIHSREKYIKKEKLRRVFRYSFAAVISIAFLALCAVTFFKVNTINVVGNHIYSADELIEASGIMHGQNLYELNGAYIEEQVMINCPFVKSVKIRREVPSTVEMIIEEDKPCCYVKISDEYFLLSDNLRVMAHSYDSDAIKYVRDFSCEKSESNDAADSENISDEAISEDELIFIKLPKVSSAIVGCPIAFERQENFDLMRDIISDINGSKLSGYVNIIDFSDRFNIFVIFKEHRFKLDLGKYDRDFSVKLDFGNEISNDENMDGKCAELNLKYTSNAIATMSKSPFYD